MTEETKIVDTPREPQPEIMTDEISSELRAEANQTLADNGNNGDTAAPAKSTDGKTKPKSDVDKEKLSGDENADDSQGNTQTGKRKRRLERKVRRLHSENEELRTRLSQLESKVSVVESGPSKQTDGDAAQERPKQADYETYDDYLEALTDWKFEQRETKKQSSSVVPEPSTKTTEQPTDNAPALSREAQDAIPDIFEDGNEKYADFEQVVRNKDVPITPQLLNAIVDSDSPEDVLYHIAQDAALARDLADMNPQQLAREIAKLEGQISGSGRRAQQTGSNEGKETTRAPAKKITNAPDPVAPVDGGGDTGMRNPDNMSMDEYAAMRRKQERQSGGYY